MENYIGKTQIVSGTSIQLTITDQKADKIIVELDDGRFFRTDITHWDNGFDKLNNLSQPYDFIGLKGKDKKGNNITIIEVDKWTMGNNIKIKVQFDDGTITNSRYKTFLEGKVVKSIKKEGNEKEYLKPVSEKVQKQHIGEISKTLNGEEMTIIQYINSHNVTVKFNNGLIKNTSYAKFARGEVSTNEQYQKLTDRIGETNMSHKSGLMRIIEYNSTQDITVLFEKDGTTKKTSYRNFKIGKVESDFVKIQRELEIKRREELIEKQRQEKLERNNKLGETIILENGMVATITKFTSKNQDVEVTIGDNIVITSYTAFKNGLKEWVNQKQRQNMIGTIVKNNKGTKATIITFDSKTLTFDLKLDNGYKFSKKCSEVERGIFSTPYDITTYGIGFLGEKFKATEYPVIYKKWTCLLERVYADRKQKNFQRYKDCIVCERWHNFSNFCQDMLNVWYDCDEQLDLDKDIKYKGNKEYSPDKCLLVPHRINLLFNTWRGKNSEHQVGVQYVKSGEHKGEWAVKPLGRRTKDEEQFRTGVHKHFKNEKDAGEYYRKIKKEYVLKVLESYEGKIPDYVINYCLKFDFKEDDNLK